MFLIIPLLMNLLFMTLWSLQRKTKRKVDCSEVRIPQNIYEHVGQVKQQQYCRYLGKGKIVQTWKAKTQHNVRFGHLHHFCPIFLVLHCGSLSDCLLLVAFSYRTNVLCQPLPWYKYYLVRVKLAKSYNVLRSSRRNT